MILDKVLRNCQSHLNVKGDYSLISIFGSICYSYQNCLGIGRFLMEVGGGETLEMDVQYDTQPSVARV